MTGAAVTPGSASGGALTEEERVAELEDRLEKSLARFDGLLLAEQEAIAARGGGGGATGTETGGADGNSGAGGSVAHRGAADGPAGEGAGRGEQARAAEEPGGGSGSDSGGEHGGDGGGARGGVEMRGSGRTPADIPDVSDDDIVARQLREAALSEEDPELREQLWEEYRRYKGLPSRAGRTGATATPTPSPTPAEE